MIFLEPPEGFDPVFSIVSVYCFVGEEILLLKRLEGKSQGGKWGIPGGKIDPGESPEVAAVREFDEETGIALDESSLRLIDKHFVRYPDIDFVAYTFRTSLAEKPAVRIEPKEHEAFRWMTPIAALEEELVLDEKHRLHRMSGV